MTSPDSPSPRTRFQKGRRDTTMTLTPTGREPIEFRADDTYGLIEQLAKRILEAEAAQEAPAPEGLRQAILNLRTKSTPKGRFFYSHLVDRDAVLALLDAATPSPAEPPRAERNARAIETLRRWRDEGDAVEQAETLAVLQAAEPVEMRAEARPPEGLDPDRLARAMHDENFCDNWSPGYWTLGPAPHHTPILDSAGDMAAHRRDADRLLARLSARGAEPR